MKNILFVNACVRPESRTKMLAEYLMEKLEGEVTVVDLEKENIQPLDEQSRQLRDQILDNQDWSHPMLKYAHQFAKADVVVVAAPYWDLSFPALLKNYMENITVVGVTFAYSNEGYPYGLCSASKLFYVTTAGGPIVSDEYGFGYIKALSQMFYGIKEVEYIKAEGLDIYGADVQQILEQAKGMIDQ